MLHKLFNRTNLSDVSVEAIHSLSGLGYSNYDIIAEAVKQVDGSCMKSTIGNYSRVALELKLNYLNNL